MKEFQKVLKEMFWVEQTQIYEAIFEPVQLNYLATMLASLYLVNILPVMSHCYLLIEVLKL